MKVLSRFSFIHALFSALQPLPQRRNVRRLSLLATLIENIRTNYIQATVSQFGHARRRKEPTDFHSFHIPLVRMKFYLYELLPRTIALRNRLPRQYFTDNYDLNLFMTRVNRYLSYISRHNMHMLLLLITMA